MRKMARSGRGVLLAGMLAPVMAGPGLAEVSPGIPSPAPGQTQSGRSGINLQAEYRKGIELLDAGKYEEAEEKFRKILRAAPSHPTTNFLLGLSLYLQEDMRGARKYFQKAVDHDETNINARGSLGVVEAKLGNTDAARTHLAALEKQRADCADPCGDAARLDQAIMKVRAALEKTAGKAGGDGAQEHSRLHPGDLEFTLAAEGKAAYTDAVRLINLGRFEAALRELERVSATFGPHPNILTYQGFANRKLHRFEAALAYYRAALAIDPDHRGANEYLGEMFVERGDLASARVQLARLETICAFGCEEAEELRRWIMAVDS